MKVAIIIFPGSNCDKDIMKAVKIITGKNPILVWHKDTSLPSVDLIILPGGFSYGDYLRCGALAAKSSILESVISSSLSGVPILGICNGFQILLETNLLPGVLIRNKNLKFICKNIKLKVNKNVNSIFSNSLPKNKILEIPIAHNEGNYFISNLELNKLKKNNQILFTYYGHNNSNDYNPNGSVEDIAGIISSNGRTLGMMPHPERALGDGNKSSDGLLFLKGLFIEINNV